MDASVDNPVGARSVRRDIASDSKGTIVDMTKPFTGHYGAITPK